MTQPWFNVPNDESYGAIESPNGELGFYLAGNGTEAAYRAALPAAFVHSFCPVSVFDSRSHAERRRGRVGKFEYHCRRVGPLEND